MSNSTASANPTPLPKLSGIFSPIGEEAEGINTFHDEIEHDGVKLRPMNPVSLIHCPTGREFMTVLPSLEAKTLLNVSLDGVSAANIDDKAEVVCIRATFTPVGREASTVDIIGCSWVMHNIGGCDKDCRKCPLKIFALVDEQGQKLDNPEACPSPYEFMLRPCTTLNVMDVINN